MKTLNRQITAETPECLRRLISALGHRSYSSQARAEAHKFLKELKAVRDSK